MRDTSPLLAETEFPPIKRRGLNTLQLNLGYRCNLACIHCHVSAGPNRTEKMDRAASRAKGVTQPCESHARRDADPR